MELSTHFREKEANEVIFLLGCDAGEEAAGAVRWVNSNIVNVAVTRAKYRLYVIGDSSMGNEPVRTPNEGGHGHRCVERDCRATEDRQGRGCLAERRPFGGKTAEGNKRSSPAIPSVHSFPIKEQAEEAGTEEIR